MSFFRCEHQPAITEVPRHYANRAAAGINNFLASTREEAQKYLGTGIAVVGVIGITAGIIDSLKNHPENDRDMVLIMGSCILIAAGLVLNFADCRRQPQVAAQQQNVPVPIQPPQNLQVNQEEVEDLNSDYQLLNLN